MYITGILGIERLAEASYNRKSFHQECLKEGCYMKTYEEQLKFARRIARTIGGRILKAFGNPIATLPNGGRPFNPVTEVDRWADTALRERFAKLYPDYSILTEEGGFQEHPRSEYTWIADPLDGTAAFRKGLADFAISIALLYGTKPVVGVVYDPVRKEVFTASEGGGAYLNDRPLSVGNIGQLDEALVSIEHKLIREGHSAIVELSRHIERQRTAATCSLELAYVASGRIDGLLKGKQKVWDPAAGILLVREAGGLVTNFEGAEPELRLDPNAAGTDILASNRRLHAQLLYYAAQLKGA